jgi:hypothetical protein
VGEFIEYLENKRIDALAFEKEDSELFFVWKTEFLQMHPKSFTAQKLYLINNLRRKYLLPDNRVKQYSRKAKDPIKKPLANKSKSTSEIKGTPSSIKPKIIPGNPVIKPKVVQRAVKKETSKVNLNPKIPRKNNVIIPGVEKSLDEPKKKFPSSRADSTKEKSINQEIAINQPIIKIKVPITKGDKPLEGKKVLPPKIMNKQGMLKPKIRVKKPIVKPRISNVKDKENLDEN